MERLPSNQERDHDFYETHTMARIAIDLFIDEMQEADERLYRQGEDLLQEIEPDF